MLFLYSSTLAWKIPWTEEPGGLQSVGGKDLDTPEQLSTQAGVCMCVYKLLLDWKRSVFIPTPKKGNAKESSNYRTIALISHASKVMLKILQARLQQYVNSELPDVQAGFRKG